MLALHGSRFRHCDHVARRSFLSAGVLGLAGLTLADVLRADAAAPRGRTGKSVINIHLDGGPPQMDTFDPKPDGPAHVRGEFASIATAVPGLHFCELLPKIASIADRLCVLRAVVGSTGQHDAFQTQSGWDEKSLKPMGGRPAMGSVVSKLLGRPDDAVPAFVDMMQGRGLVRDSARPGFLGPSHRPFRPNMDAMFSRPLEEGMKKELANRGPNHQTAMRLLPGMDARRLGDRRSLLSEFDRVRREIDASGAMDAADHFTQQALGILTSGRFADALDLSREDPRLIARYTPGADPVPRDPTSEGPESARKLLLARRLVEAGVRCVSVSLSDYDTHANHYPRMRQLLPILDTGLHALVTDLEERGMLGDVAIVVWGEFGRTPTINKDGGRDHWPRVSPALLAGGGMQTGMALGRTDRHAGEPVERAVRFQDIIATLYHVMGIDPATTLTDPQGRPQMLVEAGQAIAEVL